MPKTSVDEHGDPCPDERDIRAAAELREPVVDAEAQATFVQG
jgi:hypothetical protein